MQELDAERKGHQIISLVHKFYLHELDSEWIDCIINSDFSEVDDFSNHFESVHQNTNFIGLFNAVNDELRDYVKYISLDNAPKDHKRSISFLSTSSMSEDEEAKTSVYTKFWINITKSFKIKSLLSFLYYFIYKGQVFNSNETDRELSIHASSTYFILVAVPGSNAFRVFHPSLYTKSLDVFKLTIKLNIAASCLLKSNAAKSARRASIEERNEVDEEYAEQSFIDVNEAKKLLRLINVMLHDFITFLKLFSLKHSPETIEESASVLVQVTRCEVQKSKEIFSQRHPPNSLSSLCYNSYVALQTLCNFLHGSVKDIVLLVMKELLMSILMTFCGSSEFSMRALGIIREHSLIFVKYLMFQLKENSYNGVFVLTQHLCLRVPDKADYREKISKAVVDIIIILPNKYYFKFMQWFFQFSHNDKASHRLFALEVISKLLDEEERNVNNRENSQMEIEQTILEDTPNTSTQNVSKAPTVGTDHSIEVPANREIYSHKFLICIIFSRCRDVAATVRSKALALLALCTISDNPTINEQMNQIFFQDEPVVFTTPHISNANINCESPLDQLRNMELPNKDMLMTMLKKRAQDGKVTVRKSALMVIENLLKLNEAMVQDIYLQILIDHCRDPALLIRKQMINSLTSIVMCYAGNLSAIKSWVKGVLPLSIDPEVKVQEKVVEYVDQLICRRIHRYQSDSNLGPDEILPWRILDAVARLSYHKFLNKVLMFWSKSECYAPQLLAKLTSHIRGPFDSQTWAFLAIISQYVPIKGAKFAIDYFEENFNKGSQVKSSTLNRVLTVLCNCTKSINEEDLLKLRETMVESLSSFSVNTELISPMVNFLSLITYHLEPDEESGTKMVEDLVAPILRKCDDYLKQILFPKKPVPATESTEEELFRYLYTLGDVSQLCPGKVNKRMFLMLQSLIFHQKHTRHDVSTRVPSTQTQSSQPPAISFTPTSKIQNLSVITLSKMCLQHEDQAKRIIPALGKMLESTTLASMKTNIIVALSDMCVRYATLVDPLMPQVTACLRDPDVTVRKTTLTLLINLLQEDYLKLKDSFFYRILQCLCDDEEDIRNTVDFYMTERLLKRTPKILLQHFVECIFHYNCYEEHESYNRFRQNDQEKELFSLSGAENRDQRMMLYKFMLDHMQDDQRFATTQRLCQDVLGGVVDGRIKLTPSSLPMLEDTLMVLSCEEIKLAWLKSGPDDANQPVNTDEQAEMAGIAIKKTIISQVVKRNVIENIVPILIGLKHKLEENHSPLMKQLLLYFKEIMKDYKNEVKEILAGDKLIAKEIEFDLRRLEEEEKQREAQNIAKQAKNAPITTKASIGNSPRLNKELQANPDKKSSRQSKETPDDDVGIPSPLPEEVQESSKGDESGEEEQEGESDNVSTSERSVSSDAKSNRVKFTAKKSDKSLRKNLMIKLHRLKQTDTLVPNASKASSQVDDHDGEKMKKESGIEPPLSSITQKSITPDEIDEEEETADVSDNPKEPLPPKAPSDVRQELLRAISTPTQKKVISNITFMNQTQHLSRISFNESDESSTSHSTTPQSLLLHFRSPEAFAKDKEFSRVRKSADNKVRKSEPSGELVVSRRSQRKRKSKEDKTLQPKFMQSLSNPDADETTESFMDDSSVDTLG